MYNASLGFFHDNVWPEPASGVVPCEEHRSAPQAAETKLGV